MKTRTAKNAKLHKLEIELSNRLINENMTDNFGLCICEATGLTIARPSKMNAAHIVGKGALGQARLDEDNIVIVLSCVHDLMDNQGGEIDDLIYKLPIEIQRNATAIDNLKDFFNELPQRIENIKLIYS